jgi:hypothetical protein
MDEINSPDVEQATIDRCRALLNDEPARKANFMRSFSVRR